MSKISRLALRPVWSFAEWFNRRYLPWHKLPPLLGVLNLIIIRSKLRALNLFDAEWLPAVPPPPTTPPAPDSFGRSANGAFTCPHAPRSGAAMTRFGRNFPPAACVAETSSRLLTPDPRLVSRELFTRETFQPAGHLNLLMAAWIQFMVHDWFRHGQDTNSTFFELYPRKHPKGALPALRVPHTPPDPTRPTDGSSTPTFLNRETHWWDASQLYGSRHDTVAALRLSDRAEFDLPDGLLPFRNSNAQDPSPKELSGVTDNWWVGLSLLHRLFALEHNAICSALRGEYPCWNEERLFATARLINAAVIAKIHMLEWTPALLAHPAMEKGMHTAWWGIAGKRAHQILRDTPGLHWIKWEFLRGIPGSKCKDYGVPYSVTEEFVAVYRMHSLLPDTIDLYSERQRAVAAPAIPLREAILEHTRSLLTASASSLDDWFYSLAVQPPGALCLGNFPRSLHDAANSPLDPPFDLAAVDILRDRSRGVPRYNRFREGVHLPKLHDFEAFDPAFRERVRELYSDQIDDVDLMVGLHCEPRPAGFAIGETAFRIFLLMASRRLQADPWFTTHYNARNYTRTGLDWIDEASFAQVLRRHHPRLAPLLDRVDNPFRLWQPLSDVGKISHASVGRAAVESDEYAVH